MTVYLLKIYIVICFEHGPPDRHTHWCLDTEENMVFL